MAFISFVSYGTDFLLQVMRFNQRRQNVAEYVEGHNTGRHGFGVQKRLLVKRVAASEKVRGDEAKGSRPGVR